VTSSLFKEEQEQEVVVVVVAVVAEVGNHLENPATTERKSTKVITRRNVVRVVFTYLA
jgi:hypothetical protein